MTETTPNQENISSNAKENTGKVTTTSKWDKYIINKPETENTNSNYRPNIDAMYYLVFCGVSSYFELNPVETIVLSFVCSFQRKNKYCYATKDLMARIAGTTPATVYKALGRLKNRKLLIQSYRNGKVCLILGPEAMDKWKYIDSFITKTKDGRKVTPKAHNNIW
jgi:hypothetical protein